MTPATTYSLKFSKATEQAKLKGIEEWLGYKPNVFTFSLPSGYTCPFALDCLSKADRITGKITDGKHTEYRCFSATTEAYSATTRAQRWHNFDILRHLDYHAMVDVLMASLPAKCDICRVHVGGDFFNQRYFNAWMEVARLNPNTTFYAYTKSIPYWVSNLGKIPSNFVLTASRGGRMDHLINAQSLKVAEVVFSLEEAEEKGLPIDHDEYHAINDTGDFALLIHGTQPKGSDANKAMRNLKAQGVKFAYSRK
jgi:hypothetical protein